MTDSPPATAAPCTCTWSHIVGRRLCPACIERHMVRNRDREADY